MSGRGIFTSFPPHERGNEPLFTSPPAQLHKQLFVHGVIKKMLFALCGDGQGFRRFVELAVVEAAFNFLPFLRLRMQRQRMPTGTYYSAVCMLECHRS